MFNGRPLRINQVNAIYNGGRVVRYHSTTFPRKQSVAEHSYGVASLCALCSLNPSAELLSAALFHDIAECVTGDIPAPVKTNNKKLGEMCACLERDFMETLWLTTSITEDEKVILKFCDMLEGMLFSLEEYRAGYPPAKDMFYRWESYIDNKFPPIKYGELLNRRSNCNKYRLALVSEMKELENERK